jgi:thiol-disulfide isomerase/thioredoxin
MMKVIPGKELSAMSIFLRIACAALLLPAAPAAKAQAPTEAKPTPSASAAAARPAYESDPKFVKTLDQAKQELKRKQASFAADDFKKANKIAGGRCVECVGSLYTAQMMEGSYKDAMATAAAYGELNPSPLGKSLAASERGQAMMGQAGLKPKPAQLEAAHAAFQEAIAAYPKNVTALYLDGQVLAKLGRTDEARSDFQQCLSCIGPGDPVRLRAQHFAENPELATHQMAPAFEVTALDGSKFNLDAMGGRVVLIDFWATWCGPCNEELPHMKKIAKEFAGQPLVIISVSWDSDEAKWKQFIDKNEMTWVQYRDADHKLSNEFGINAIPHYFTIDADGVLTAEMLGSGSDVEGKLKKLIAKAREAQAAPALAKGGAE